MSQPFRIVNTQMEDLPSIVQWFDASIQYQVRKGYPTWGNYDQGAVMRDIKDGNSYKVVNDQGAGIVFSVVYADKIIWRHHDDGKSIYLHRIVVNPEFKGQKLFGEILNWAKDEVKKKGLTHIRMDTWQNNPVIKDYYKSYGFEEVEDYTTPDSEELPAHNRNLALTLLEYRGSL